MSLDPYEKSLICARAALARRAVEPVILQVGKISSVTDYFVIVTGVSTRQVQTIAQAVEEALGGNNLHPFGVEGYQDGRWVLIDYLDVVVHVFLEPVRRFYDLERLWDEAPRLDEAAITG